MHTWKIISLYTRNFTDRFFFRKLRNECIIWMNVSRGAIYYFLQHIRLVIKYNVNWDIQYTCAFEHSLRTRFNKKSAPNFCCFDLCLWVRKKVNPRVLMLYVAWYMYVHSINCSKKYVSNVIFKINYLTGHCIIRVRSV